MYKYATEYMDQLPSSSATSIYWRYFISGMTLLS
jgi:hypothetical protein